MCGIAGRYAIDGSPLPDRLIDGMIDLIRHRGPDARGCYVDGALGLGHARLAIVDLSPLGEQPMTNEDESLWLTYNGEIYNFRELAEELQARGHVFRSHSDSEVILHAYEEWGRDCLERFNGMWAFALWDRRRQTLFCARDRMGVKPFYYHWDSRELLFASEIKALLGARPALRQPHWGWVRHLLVEGLVDDTAQTAFAGVQALPAAHWLLVDEHGLRIGRYWDWSDRARARQASGNPVGTLRELLADSVRLRLRADVPVGTCLSGGIDSSAIVALASRDLTALHPDGRVNTFSAIYPGRAEADESTYVDIVNRATGAIAHPVEPIGADLPRVFPRIVWHQDEPTVGPGLYAQWHVMERAHGRVKVLLDGQGSDELLAGYHDYLPMYLTNLVDRALRLDAGSLGRLVRDYPRLTSTAGRGLLLSTLRGYAPGAWQDAYRRARGTDAEPDLHAALDERTNGERLCASYPQHFPDRLNNALYGALTATSLPALLRYEDRNSMAFSIEARVPFLDYRLVEYCLGLPIELKLRGGETKHVLRRALEGIVPPEVLARRDKKGYPTPAATWFRHEAHDWARAILLDERTRQRRVLDLGSVERRLDQHRDGARDWSWQIWRWLSLELWFRQLVDGLDPGGT